MSKSNKTLKNLSRKDPVQSEDRMMVDNLTEGLRLIGEIGTRVVSEEAWFTQASPLLKVSSLTSNFLEEEMSSVGTPSGGSIFDKIVMEEMPLFDSTETNIIDYYKMGKALKTISPTSTVAERVFSAAGWFITKS
ncbi:hypothetical protein TNCV_2008381 [Trichonephila clavipes]|nr:hypothetical protein TNCV_2008381 [Trichonephila clavipes]